MRTRTGTWFGAWAIVLLASVACTGVSAEQSTRITVMVAGDAEEIEAYRAVVAAVQRGAG